MVAPGNLYSGWTDVFAVFCCWQIAELSLHYSLFSQFLKEQHNRHEIKNSLYTHCNWVCSLYNSVDGSYMAIALYPLSASGTFDRFLLQMSIGEKNMSTREIYHNHSAQRTHLKCIAEQLQVYGVRCGGERKPPVEFLISSASEN